MKLKFVTVLVSMVVGFGAFGQEAQTGKGKVLSPDERTQYVKLCQTELELSTQLRLLNELAEEHAKRLPDVANAITTDKAKWEAELVQELREKSKTLLGQANEATKRRLAFEAEHAPVPAAALAGATLEEGKGYSPDEFVYLYKVDERLTKVRQELIAVADAAKGYYAQLQTNTTAEAVSRVSELLQENTRIKNLWERDQAELELRKLEFRALRKP